MKEFVKKVVDTGRPAFTVFTLAVLAISCIAAVERLIPAFAGPSEELPSTSVQVGQAAETAPTCDAAENMATDGEPSSKPSASFVALLILKNDNTNNRLRTHNEAASEIDILPCVEGPDSPILTSSCLIDSALGRQSTLVGARPSGTS